MNPTHKALHDGMIGRRFGKLTVVAKAKRTSSKARFVCRCECGAMIERTGQVLRGGKVTSCCCCRAAMCACGRRFGLAA